ncbi:MAG TPA: alpha/beta hydrolase [Cytophagaceae bacterium]|nr:alpha/beta hydrolase [Cytophagaceae bacterium]
MVAISFLSCKKDPAFNDIYPVYEKEIFQDLSYGNNVHQKMDVYLPANRNSTTRAVIFIHGGAWFQGDKSDWGSMMNTYADSGIAAVAINYRLVDSIDGITYHSILNDIDSAIAFLQRKEKLYNVSFSTYTLFGQSAGSHLALMYSIERANVRQVVALAAPSDLNDPNLLAVYDMTMWIDNMIGSNDPFQRTAASPISYQNRVPTYLYHGKADEVVPYHQSVAYYNHIQSLNPENKLTLFDNNGHDLVQVLPQIVAETIALIKK